MSLPSGVSLRVVRTASAAPATRAGATPAPVTKASPKARTKPFTSASPKPPSASAWDVQYQALVEFRRVNGHCHTALGSDERLVRWTQLQRALRRQNQLLPDRVARLDAIGMVWNRHTSQWEARLHQLRQFKAARGHVRVPTSGSLGPLGAWVQNQRTSQRLGRLAPERLQKLDALGMEWAHHRLPPWESRFADLVAYAAANGGMSDVPLSESISLHNWVSSQRTQWRKGLMPPDRAARLESIGFVWDAQQAAWEARLAEYVRLREEMLHVHARIADGSMSVAELVSAAEAGDAVDEGGEVNLERAARELCLQRLAAAQTAKGRASAASVRQLRKRAGGSSGPAPTTCDLPPLVGGAVVAAGNGVAAGCAAGNGVASGNGTVGGSAAGNGVAGGAIGSGVAGRAAANGAATTPWGAPRRPGSPSPAVRPVGLPASAGGVTSWTQAPEASASVVPTKLPLRLRKLQLWMLTQRRLLRTGALRSERFALLLGARFDFDWFDLEWERGFARLASAVSTSGGRWHARANCLDEGLLFWVRTQRSAKRAGALALHRVRRLEELGVFEDTFL
eukprot:TRINITY_DN3043_c0_g1_i3.p1 TRINITY_DN3043_c0_g1~~TRINITY_DN3043_c0_g1_i3.p1  ORF type:complete len:655 (+),score=211.33 TRINITY_DN3043_c0_g1_i3:270-1967(+)